MRIPELNRINELARKAKLTALSLAELNERDRLRQRYLMAIRGQVNNSLASVTVVDPLGNDVTPLKLRQAQRSGMMTN
ncbi:DUF896 domain-containing protein [Testudinibacter sp. TR-2022]|uniref:DUF896 domain-containing protein n=1 Tax=Testudinibacter sp. TR-2022 TaxID=2585029 RepID=UPI001118CC39|nr:DUF896 domain-containing protein [Testudinibacter sp. TR-2022]TNG93445.1 DUF896 domain-containing protein [Pasteurellaceae bacterium UScroc12]TNG96528.1 DUF896 domain-containing protein [Pasteurellaceae bacterium USgator41]TNH01346.1 DUF896 domain-containing protein [Pasteurellaceae bacterium USgator11]TNH01447.1 DUF896 domain-containing protein [Pasteurellaceae bacterium UScroc31]TNH07264.1 DUF896 domain-containing protein [Pasteurellaceae bacterium Phil11]